MGHIYTWVKNLVCFYLLLTVVLHLLPQKSYRKYVRFFAGMLLSILVVSPILALMGNEEVLRSKISQAEFFQDLDNIRLDTEYLETLQKEAYLREYENALEMDVGRMAKQKQLVPQEVRVRMAEDYEVESIEMTVSFEEDDIMFVQKASYENESTEYPKVYELRQELQEYYRLDENQISIVIV